MIDTMKFNKIDVQNNVVHNDSSNYELSVDNSELYKYKDFKFVTEQSSGFDGPKERDVSYISAGWNFLVLFVAMIVVTLNKFLFPQRFLSVISMPLKNTGGEKIFRESHSFLNVMSLSVLSSFVLIISLLIQKVFVIYGNNFILHENFNFFMNVVVFVSAIMIFNYLITSFYGWLFKAESLIYIHVNLYVSSMATANLFMIPILMMLLLYPYRSFLLIGLIILAVFYFIRFTKLLIEVRMLSKLNFVNIFLYLCTIEILPLLVISKVIIDAV